jgi:hypothetical protein
MKTGVINPKDPNPYYPYTNPALHPQTSPPAKDFSIPMNRYTNNIKQNDQAPYYGPPEKFRAFYSPQVTGKVVY